MDLFVRQYFCDVIESMVNQNTNESKTLVLFLLLPIGYILHKENILTEMILHPMQYRMSNKIENLNRALYEQSGGRRFELEIIL